MVGGSPASVSRTRSADRSAAPPGEVPSPMLTRDRAVEAEARLRAKNQLTLPEPIADALDAQVDDVLVFETVPDVPGTARGGLGARRFAGALPGLYGTTDEGQAVLRR